MTASLPEVDGNTSPDSNPQLMGECLVLCELGCGSEDYHCHETTRCKIKCMSTTLVLNFIFLHDRLLFNFYLINLNQIS